MQAVFSRQECEEMATRGAAARLPLGPCAGAAQGCRHSTKKKTSTTSRTTKRTAMAHHWRRSGRQDRRISARDAALPKVQPQARPRGRAGTESARVGTQRLQSLRGGPAPRVHPRLGLSPENRPLKCVLRISSRELDSVALGLLLLGAPCPWKAAGIGLTDQSPSAFISH